MPRVLILGSCVSRDILNYDGSGGLVLADYFARSSIASLVSTPAALDEDAYGRIASPFQRRTVRRDVDKEFLRNWTALRAADVILIDLIDERFDLFELAPDCLITVSSELLLTGAVSRADRSTERWIASGSPRHRALWKAGLEKLFAALRRHGVADRVIVNKVFWADSLEDGAPLPGSDLQATRAANELLEWMYGQLEAYVAPERWLRFPGALLRANAAHRWGIAPFHYTDGYYRQALQQIEKLIGQPSPSAAPVGARQEGNVLIASASASATQGLVQKFAFMVFRDGRMLVHQEFYSDRPEMRFDTGGRAGEYEVVAFVLSWNAREPLCAPRRTTQIMRFSV